MVLILSEVFNKKMRGVYSHFTQLENMNNKICLRKIYTTGKYDLICLRKKYEHNTHTY